jgi:hypothetical protein
MSTVTDTPQMTAHWLYAAVQVARNVVGAGGWTQQQLRDSYWQSSTGGTLGHVDLVHGQTLLEHLGLLVWRHGRCYPARQFDALRDLPDDVGMKLLLHRGIDQERPLWLFAYMDPERDPDPRLDLPEGIGETLRKLYPDDDELAAELRGLARKVDTELLNEIGLAGEQHVVQECQRYFNEAGDPGLAHLVRRMSEFDDTLGYDVTATDRAAIRHKIEVKTTTAAPHSHVSLYLSRHEAEVGLASANWTLVAVRDWFDDQGSRELQTIGWLPATRLRNALPVDVAGTDVRGRWQSVRLEIPHDWFEPGLPLDKLSPPSV